MSKLRYYKAASIVGQMKDSQSVVRRRNHFASTKISPEVQQKITSMGLLRVAGNVYECPSSQDFWQVTGGGKIVRLSGNEVDNGESIPAAPNDNPGEYLTSILNDLEF